MVNDTGKIKTFVTNFINYLDEVQIYELEGEPAFDALLTPPGSPLLSNNGN